MKVAAVLLALHLIFVHGPDNQRILLNVDEISSIREPRKATESHFGKDIRCLIFMTNGQFLGIMESCEEIHEKIKDLEKNIEPPQ